MTSESVRIDKWLWAARFFKTRTMAADAVDSGKIRLNGERVKPARSLKPGDRLDIDNGSTEWEVVVQELSDVRRAASFAQALYQETEESVERRARVAEDRRYFREPGAGLKGRPTKRDRRLITRSQS
jgi:ribosome-associated heat shock protein Hsp15